MQLLSIDVTKIDKTALVAGKPKPDGHVPKYMDLAMMDNKAGRDEYGNDGFIVQSLSVDRHRGDRRERDAGERGPIIGNWKTLERRGAAAPPKPSKPAPADGAPTEDDDVPF